MLPYAFNKRAYLNRAEHLLEKNDEDLLRYVCLELRFCLEAIAYEKLRTYAPRLPDAILNTWQPPQAIRALLEFEPLADQDFVLRISPESEPGVPTGEWTTLGTHRTLPLSWLRKFYNKLGHYLHVPQPGSDRRTKLLDPSREQLKRIVAELKPAIETTFDLSLAAVRHFECSVCHLPSFANIEAARKRQKVLCLNPNCQAEFFPEFDQTGNAKLHLISTEFGCLSCGKPIRVENRKLKIGLGFSCLACGAPHQIVSRQWGYGLPDTSKSTAG